MVKEVSTFPVSPGSFVNRKVKTHRHKLRPPRYFFVAMASLFLIVVVLGFTPSYFAIRAGTMHVGWFVHVHGAFMTTWLLVFLTQTILAVRGNLKFHRQLGQFSVVLGVLVWISMGVVIFNAHIGYPIYKNISWDIVLLLTATMNLFGLFFAWGIPRTKKRCGT